MIEQPFPHAPPIRAAQWFNTPAPLTPEALRGRVVVLHAFQMLCPACVAHGLPQAQAVHRQFKNDDVAVIGVHTVFEHHDAMTPTALAAFIHEYRLTFPIAVDQPSPELDIPMTMRAYGMRGTPSLVVIDRAGLVRLHGFGRVEDLALGALIGRLLVDH